MKKLGKKWPFKASLRTPSHYSWEICANPRERETQAVLELVFQGRASA